ncbi:hypothetical protein [uncultured phage MedDCM-OCT-S01-C58]|nr:hypothetical protein [uncultured phage MedDCM-OCT-S01-C58]BAR24304.1 Na-Ca exchanger/integrin-beta4 [uncultured Mediterranean phage uvMED]
MGYYIGSRALPMDRPWTAENGTQYPANWLRLSSTADRDAIGVSWGADDPVYDQRFWWSPTLAKQLDDKTETVDGAEVTTTGLKTQWKSKQNDIAGTLIAPSDWRIIKAKETSTNIPSAWKTYRAAVRTSCNTRQTEIDACTTVDELKELLFGSETITRQKTDSDGKVVVDSDGNDVLETVANPNIATAWPTEPS